MTEEWKLVEEKIHPMDSIRIPGAARRLIDALDRMKKKEPFSLNVQESLSELRALIEFHEKKA